MSPQIEADDVPLLLKFAGKRVAVPIAPTRKAAHENRLTGPTLGKINWAQTQ
jgi:hypothetical protein